VISCCRVVGRRVRAIELDVDFIVHSLLSRRGYPYENRTYLGTSFAIESSSITSPGVRRDRSFGGLRTFLPDCMNEHKASECCTSFQENLYA